jgi:hypothetical protein
MAESAIAKLIRETGKPIGDQRSGHGGEFVSPNQFIENVLVDWMEDDVFYRRHSKTLARDLNNAREKTSLVIFKKQGLDAYFGYVECRTQLMSRLNLGQSIAGAYSTQLRAALMMFLASEGLEFVGVYHAQSIFNYNHSVNHPPQTRNFSVDKSLIGKTIRQIEHVGFHMDPHTWGENKWCLIPKALFSADGGE